MKQKFLLILCILVIILNANLTVFAFKGLDQYESTILDQYQNGGLKSAEAEYKILKKKKDVNEYTYIAMMSVYMEEEQYDKATLVGFAGVKKFPKSYMIYNLIGSSYKNVKKYNEAIWAYSRSIKIIPTEPPYYNRGRIWAYVKNDYARAIDDFTNALECLEEYKNNAETYNNFATDIYAERATAYFNSKNYDKAIADYNMVIIYDHSNAQAYLFRAKSKILKLMEDCENDNITPTTCNKIILSVAQDIESTMRYAREQDNAKLYNEAVKLKNVIKQTFGSKNRT